MAGVLGPGLYWGAGQCNTHCAAFSYWALAELSDLVIAVDLGSSGLLYNLNGAIFRCE